MKEPQFKNITYTRNINQLPFRLSDEVTALIRSGTKDILRYIAVIHGQELDDLYEQHGRHMHILIEFKEPKHIRHIAKWIGEDIHQISPWNEFQECFMYLLGIWSVKLTISDIKASFGIQSFIRNELETSDQMIATKILYEKDVNHYEQ